MCPKQHFPPTMSTKESHCIGQGLAKLLLCNAVAAAQQQDVQPGAVAQPAAPLHPGSLPGHDLCPERSGNALSAAG